MRLAALDKIGVDRTRTLGRPSGFDAGPVRIGPDDTRVARLSAKATRVLSAGEKFSSEELHELLARLTLG